MPKFVALGEILIDFMPDLVSGGQLVYTPHVGGAPANVARAMAALGHSSAFIGKVGNDSFGELCKHTLSEAGVDIRGLLTDMQNPTTLALVHLSDDGERSFSFYRNQTADVNLCKEEIPTNLLEAASILHIGSVSLSAEPSAEATLSSIRYTKDKGTIVSYDPNLRPLLWRDMNAARNTILEPLRFCDILKISEEETEFIAGESNPQKAAQLLYDRYGIPLILVSLGRHGCCALHNGHFFSHPGFSANTVDTTGAGDCFFAGALHCILQSSCHLTNLSDAQIADMLRFANAMGAGAVQQKGADCPDPGTVNSLLQRQ